MRADQRGEAAEPFLRMVVGLDRDEHGDAEPDLVLIDRCATRLWITPSASSRWMRFQQGVDDSPTRCPISATDSEASSCRVSEDFPVDGVHQRSHGISWNNLLILGSDDPL